MIFYAQLNENDICVGVSQLSGEVENEKLIRIESFNNDLLWKKYENGQWSLDKFEPISTAPLTEFEQLKADNEKLKTDLSQAQLDNLTTLEACAELYETLLTLMPV